MKTLEKVLGVILLIALIAKFNLIAGSDIVLFVGGTILACIYYPFGFLFFNLIRLRLMFKKAAYANTTTGSIMLAILAGLGVSTVCVGTVFKLFQYAGAQQLLLIGLVTIAVAFTPVLILYLKGRSDAYKLMLSRMLILGVVGCVFVLLPEIALVKLQYRNHPDYIKAYSEYLSDPGNEALRMKMERERNRIRQSK